MYLEISGKIIFIFTGDNPNTITVFTACLSAAESAVIFSFISKVVTTIDLSAF